MRDKRLKAFSRVLRKNETDAERRLWTLLRSRGLGKYKFRRQVVLGNFIVDFCCFEKKLIVECDGGQHLEQAGRDKERTKELEGRGFRVLRFWDHELLGNMETVMRVLWDTLEEMPPSP
jgi:very-short-patch-repair endonuclease